MVASNIHWKKLQATECSRATNEDHLHIEKKVVQVQTHSMLSRQHLFCHAIINRILVTTSSKNNSRRNEKHKERLQRPDYKGLRLI